MYNKLNIMEILFHYNETKFYIKYKKEDKMKEICNIFKKEMKLLNVNLYFLYEGNEINEELSLIQQINESEVENNTVNIFAFERDNIISIIYRINKDDKKIKLFGKTFVKNNKNNCYIFYINEKYELTEYIGLENYKCDISWN